MISYFTFLNLYTYALPVSLPNCQFDISCWGHIFFTIGPLWLIQQPLKSFKMFAVTYNQDFTTELLRSDILTDRHTPINLVTFINHNFFLLAAVFQNTSCRSEWPWNRLFVGCEVHSRPQNYSDFLNTKLVFLKMQKKW